MDRTPLTARPVRHANALALAVFSLIAVVAGILFTATGDHVANAQPSSATTTLDTSDRPVEPVARGGRILPLDLPVVPTTEPAPATSAAPVAPSAPTSASRPTAATTTTSRPAPQPAVTEQPAPQPVVVQQPAPVVAPAPVVQQPVDVEPAPECPQGQEMQGDLGCVQPQMDSERIGRQIDGPNGELCTVVAVNPDVLDCTPAEK